MDRAALRFIEMLDDESKDDDGNPLIDTAMKFKLFDKGQDWLTKRQRLKPTGSETEGSGITDMRAWMTDDKAKKALEDTIFEMGFVKAPAKHVGRPRVEERPVRERFKAHQDAKKAEAGANDDSGWEGLLGEKH